MAATEDIVDVSLSSSSHRLFLEGYVVTPRAGVSVATSDPGARLRLNGGVVASTIRFHLDATPAPAELWLIGVISEPVKLQVRFNASTTRSGTTGRSTAVFEIHRDGSYAINSWIVSR